MVIFKKERFRGEVKVVQVLTVVDFEFIRERMEREWVTAYGIGRLEEIFFFKKENLNIFIE